MKLFFSFFTFFLSVTILGQKPKVFQGQLGKYPVILELTIDEADESVFINYFYLTQRKNIELFGMVDQKGAIKAAQNSYGDENDSTIERILLNKNGSGYKGKWTRGKSSLSVSLIPISRTILKSPYDHLAYVKKLKQNVYEYIRVSGLQFAKVSQTTSGVCKIDWFREKYSGIILPRIKTGYKAEVIKKINEELLQIHLDHANNSLACLGARNGEFNLSIQNMFCQQNIFSINIFTSYYCGGAHPDFGSIGYNFDAQTGKQLDLEDVFWFGKQNPPLEDSNGWYEYRSNEFAGTVLNIFKKLYPENFKTDSNEDENCDYNDSSVWDFPNWYFTKNGLYIGPYFARAMRVCDEPEWPIIPYKVAKEFLNPKSSVKLPE
jgi:hypothetical protein